MLEQKIIKLGKGKKKVEYVIQQLPSTRGLEVGIHLVHIAMGSAEGVGSMGDDVMDVELNPARMIAGLMARIDEKETPVFIKALIQQSLITPDPGEGFDDWYETQFSANYMELWDLIAAIIEHNKYIDLVKKRVLEAMAIFSTDDGPGEESTPSSGAQS